MQKPGGLMQAFPCHPKTEQVKADFLDFLYEQSGRTNMLYSGLWQEFCLQCGLEARQAWSEQ
jgi:hypothetical protein